MPPENARRVNAQATNAAILLEGNNVTIKDNDCRHFGGECDEKSKPKPNKELGPASQRHTTGRIQAKRRGQRERKKRRRKWKPNKAPALYCSSI